ncbi:MAG: carboxypeptidase regulatory-like domain-containing protein, partial [Chlamydiae bacterium]|nr:carboxypeptidase regulatory-like domain-containing protein [Chlamydiota bacterium]
MNKSRNLFFLSTFLTVSFWIMGTIASEAAPPSKGSFSGKVTDVDTGSPLGNVPVLVYDSGGNALPLRTALTDAEGKYTILNLTAGTFYFAKTSTIQGYGSELYWEKSCFEGCTVTDGDVINVVSDQDTSDINFTLSLTGVITGTITDSQGVPLQGIQVNIYNSSGSVVSTASTDAQGFYRSLGSLATGQSYYVRTQNDQGYIDELYDNIACVADSCDPTKGTAVLLPDNEAAADINFQLKVGGAISGTVTDSATGAFLEGLEIEIYDSTAQYLFSVVTDTQGHYRTDTGLTTASYYAIVLGGDTYVSELYDNVTCVGADCNILLKGTRIAVTEGQETAGKDFALDIGGSFSGTVTDETGSPLVGIQVNIYDSKGNSVTFALTNTSGAYTSNAALAEGKYYATTTNSQGYVDELYNNVVCVGACNIFNGLTIAVTAGQNTPGIDFALSLGGVMGGAVTSDEESPQNLEGVEILVYNDEDVQVTSAFTLPVTGTYETAALPAGIYHARTLNSQRYQDEIYDNIPCGGLCDPSVGTDVEMVAGEKRSDIDFALIKQATISGYVTDSFTSSALKNVAVNIYSQAGQIVSTTLTDETGYYVSAALEAGTYFASTYNAQGNVDQVYQNHDCGPDCTPSHQTTFTPDPIVVQDDTATDGIDFALSETPPSLTGVSPNSGSQLGGTALTLSGSGFRSGATVKVGNASATNVVVSSLSTLTCDAPSHEIGAVDVTVTNPDGGSDTLTNIYTYTNEAPTVQITSPASGASFNEGSDVLIQASASDTDGTIAKVEFYAGATLIGSDANGPYEMTWQNGVVGSYDLTVVAVDDDGAATTSAVVNVSVEHVNQAPQANAGSDQKIEEGKNATLDGSASSDPEGDSLSYQWSQESGIGVTLENAQSAVAKFTTPDVTKDESLTFKLVVTDSQGLTGEDEVVVTVSKVNQAPVLDAIGAKGVSEGANLNFGVSGSDADGDSVSYSATGLPQGALFDTQSDTFNWTPGYDQAGHYDITFTVSDGTLNDSETITVTVENINRAPELNSIDDEEVSEGQSVAFTVTATDPDGDQITLSAQGVPSWATFDTGTGVFAGTPGMDDSGDYTVTFTASDGSLIDSETITISVNSVNQAPSIQVTSPENGSSFEEGDNVALKASASDPDGSISKVEFYANGILVGTDEETPYEMTWEKVGTGSYTLTAKAADNDGGETVSEGIDIRVNESPAPETLSTLTLSIDNSYTLYVNGVEIGRGSDWTQAGKYTVNLKEGDSIGIDAS